MMRFMLQHIEVKQNILADKRYKYLWSVEAVNAEVLRGVPFREAYKKIGNAISEGSFTYTERIAHTHQGSMGNLCNDKIKVEMDNLMSQIIGK